ncbi:MAG: hypothetical protein J6Y72_12370 [Bacteroidales bacterium]|nr:hypothetical protein [Bacteroidales bacterium]
MESTYRIRITYHPISKAKQMGIFYDGCCPTLLASDHKCPQCVWIFTPIDNE